jgi:hypothetical protein
MCVLPVPLLPTAITFSRRVAYSERTSSRTTVLFSEGIAAKSKLSRLLTAGNRASFDPTLHHASFSIDQLQFDEAQEKADMVETLGSALPSKLVILAQERRQLERLQVMTEQKLRRIGHDDAPASKLM